MANAAEVIIIGGGVHGASLAFHLTQRNVRVTVLEKQFVGAGATGRSSGLVRMHYDTEVEARLAWVSFAYFQNWGERVGGACGFTRTGFLQIVGPEQAEALRANVAMQQRVGINTRVIAAAEIRQIAPAFAVDDSEIAAYEPESGYAMPSDTANALLRAARARGAQLVQGCAVTGIRVVGGKVVGVETTQGDYAGPVVVNAAGAWAGRINALVGLDLPYDTWRHDTLFALRPPALVAGHPAVIDFPNEMYFRPEGGLTLVGLEDNNPLGESPDDSSDQAHAGFVERAIERICQRIPAMQDGGLQSTHGGYDGITPDQHALLGAAGPDGFYLDCGHSGAGFKTAPAVGRCMAELILDGAATTVDITPLAPTRFAEGRPLQGSYANLWK